MSQSIYVNEKSGVDTTEAKGTQEKPYATPAFALYTHPDAKVFVYKQSEEDAEKFEYVEISASALKKAKKGVEGFKKKA